MPSHTDSNWTRTTIRDLEVAGDIELGRGQIISKKDIEANPGDYPVYSSSARGDGEFGRYGKFMFDEELVTWSVDGGGKFFYRPKRKFSITNVSGFLRVRAKDKLDTYYTWAHLFSMWETMTFNYTEKLHPSVLRERFSFSYPELAEQKKIASVLKVVQRAIEQQERLLRLTAELKKTLLHQLFTHGLRGKPQKQTEIGPVPESWKVASLESAATAFDYGTSVKCEHGKVGFPVLRIPNVVGGSVDLGDLKHGEPKRTELDTLLLRNGDLLFVRTNGVLENAGRCALFRGELDDCYFASYLIRVRVDSSKVLPAFVNEYARTERGQSFLSGRAIRTADGKFNINSGTLKRVLLPLPSLEEQAEIVHQLDLVKTKLKLHEAKRGTLTDLFRSLLQQLMTAQIRVHDLDLEEISSQSGRDIGASRYKNS